eukprot:6464684-Amphidinium_carterae.1
MAYSSPPPAKRARRSCRTFELSPAVAQAVPVYTNLSDARPGHYYNLRCRVSFVSLGGLSQQGERKVLLELVDTSTHAPMKMTIIGTSACAAVSEVEFSSIVQLHKVRCSVYKNETNFIVGDRDGFRVSIIPEDQEDQFQLPAAPPMRTSGFGTLGADENGICNFLAKVKCQGEKDVTVQDAAGETGKISLGGEAVDFHFDVDETYCLHHVSIKSGRLTLWPSGGIEL